MLTPKEIKLYREYHGVSLTEAVDLGEFPYSRQYLWQLESGIAYLNRRTAKQCIQAINRAFDVKFDSTKMEALNRIETKIKQLKFDSEN